MTLYFLNIVFFSPAELRVTASLATGQCFNFRPVHFVPRGNGDGLILDEPAWVGVLGRRVVALLDTHKTTLFSCLADESLPDNSKARPLKDSENSALRQAIRAYFQLEVPLTPLYEKWAHADRRLKVTRSS